MALLISYSSAAGSCVCADGESYSPSPILGDPLSVDQKRKIYEFVQSYLNKDEKTVPPCSSERKAVKPSLIPIEEDEAAVAKTYDSYDPDSLKRTEEAINRYHRSKGNGKTFALFRCILKNPKIASEELGIDSRRDDQVFAAQMFMKVVIKNAHRESDFAKLLSKYNSKISSNRTGVAPVAISEKYRLLMENDPVEKLRHTSPLTPLSVVLSHTYFQDQLDMARDSVRIGIKDMVVNLAESEETRHVIEALATLMSREKGYIFICGEKMDELAAPYNCSFGGKSGTVSFYVQDRHTIVLPPPVDSKGDLEPSIISGCFIHEALHFLFNGIVKNQASPVKKGSEEERLLDNALANDRALRPSIKARALTPIERKVLSEMNDLNLYFLPGFDPENSKHLHLMRVESIVKVMDLLASNYPLEAIQTIAPNLCEYYFAKSKPMLEAYASGAM